MYIRLYNGILNDLPRHRKAVLDGPEQKLKVLGFRYFNGNQYCEIQLTNNIELIRMMSWLKQLGFNGGTVGWA